jgi:ribonuclease G
MSDGRKMLVESDPHQTRIALLEDDRLTEIFVERHRHRGLVGNLYKGRVTRVLPGMQAAFVDVGLERDAFLYVSDVVESGSAAEDFELDEAVGEAAPAEGEPSIADLLKAGQEIIVQVVKDPLPNKGARITTHVTLPGRHLVLLPTVRHVGVSRRIEDEAERTRLADLLREIAEEKRISEGLIVRTVGEEKGREEFEHDLEYLESLWGRIRQRAGRAVAPTLLHRDLDLALRVVRDMASADLSVLLVEGEETYARIVEFFDEVHPELIGKVKLYSQDATSSSSSASSRRSRRRWRAGCGSSQAARSSSTRPRRWWRSTSTPAASSAAPISRTRC